MTNSQSIIEYLRTVETADTAQGQVRLYNQAQVQILVTNLPVSGQPPTPQVTLPSRQASRFQRDDSNPTTYTYIWTNYVWIEYRVPYINTRIPIFTNMYTVGTQRTNTPWAYCQFPVGHQYFYRQAGISNQHVCDPD